MRIGGFERAAVIDRLRTIPLTPRLKKTLSQTKKSKIYSGEKLENMYSSTSGYDPQPFVCDDVQGWASPLRRPVWPGLLTRIVSGALLGRTILGRNPKPVGGIRAGTTYCQFFEPCSTSTLPRRPPHQRVSRNPKPTPEANGFSTGRPTRRATRRGRHLRTTRFGIATTSWNHEASILCRQVPSTFVTTCRGMLSKCTVAKWLAWGVARLESDRYAIVPFSDSTGAPTSMVGDDRLPQFLQGSQIYGPPSGAAGAESTKPGDDSWASSNVWICCDKCNRWRRVPKGVPTPSEDEPWDCSMNTWDYRYASCAVEEEPGAHDPEMPPSGPSAEQQNAVGGFGTDLARTGAESPSYYTTKQGRAGAGHLLIDFRLHGKHWVLGSVHGDSKAARPRRRGTTRRSTVGFFFANKHRRAKTHATTAGNASPTNAPPPHHN